MLKKIGFITLLFLNIASLSAYHTDCPSDTQNDFCFFPSCPEETALIERYITNYNSVHYENSDRACRFARSGYAYDKNGNLSKEVEITKAEMNAMSDAEQALRVQKYYWGFQWFAKLLVIITLDCGLNFGVHHRLLCLKSVLDTCPRVENCTGDSMKSFVIFTTKERLAAMIGKANIDYSNIDNKHLNQNAYQAVILNRNVTRQDTTKEWGVEERAQELEKHRCLPFNQAELDQALKYHYSMTWHKQKPVDYKLYNQKPEDRAKFCKNLLPMIQDRDEYIARLKAENSVDTDSKTNKFAGLFDRIAK